MKELRITGAVLALDLGTHCGFALRKESRVVKSGENTFDKKKDDDDGERLFRYLQWLRYEVRSNNVKLITYEEVNFVSSQLQHRLWCGWMTSTLLVAKIEKVAVRGFATNVVKLAASGHGAAGKPRMMAAAKSHFGLGVLPEENEADALCVLYTTERWNEGSLVIPEKKKKPRKSKAKKGKTLKQGDLLSAI
jgi:Holliday junction resolvasome RuvABC endonuclease subunit